MNTNTKSLGTAAGAALLTTMLLIPVTAPAAPGTLADSPLFLSNSVEPNILFMLDDSGSMDWEMMTAENNGIMHLTCDYRYAQPAPDHSGTSVPPTEASLVARTKAAPYEGVWRAWNSEYNRLYYDPRVTYTPWTGLDSLGNPFTNATPAAAPYDPYFPGGGARNLTATMSYDSNDCDGSGDFTVNNFFPARYNTWTDTDADTVVDPEDGHTLVEIRPATAVYTGSVL
ncbi:MAG: hypothetical protein OES09_17490, partial [Gammaproteobacteria bacterium]|nr:hypothetical protein [Gammaproteobacteria bacterium]